MSLKINDIIEGSCGDSRKIIDITDDVVVAVLIEDFDGLVDQEEDNIAEFILLSDINFD